MKMKRVANAGIINSDDAENLVLGVFEGVPTTKKSVFDLPARPDRIVLYQKNIEAVCSNEDEIRNEIRLTVLHELGHYFGMTEAQLEDVYAAYLVNYGGGVTCPVSAAGSMGYACAASVAGRVN